MLSSMQSKLLLKLNLAGCLYLKYLLVQHLRKYLFKGNLPQALFKHPYKKLPLQRSRRTRIPSSPNPLYCRHITYILPSNSLV